MSVAAAKLPAFLAPRPRRQRGVVERGGVTPASDLGEGSAEGEASCAPASSRQTDLSYVPTTRGRLQLKSLQDDWGDPFEREADEIAEQIASSGESAAAPVSLRRTVPAGDLDPHIHATVLRATTQGGVALPDEDRAYFEHRFGRDFSGVRVHTHSRAAAAAGSLKARAFTVGPDILFGAGEYAPGTAQGRRLLVHELTHVVQQQAAPPRAVASQSPPEPREEVAAVVQNMSRAFRMDFSDVQLHTDAAAARVAARRGIVATTNGREIFFAAEAFRPGTRAGDHVIAHEFAHIAQARGGTTNPFELPLPAVGTLPKERLEEEADRAVRQVLAGEPVRVRGAPLGPQGADFDPPSGDVASATGKARNRLYLPRPGHWVRVTNGKSFIYLFNPADLKGLSEEQLGRWVYEAYAKEIFGVERDVADIVATTLEVHFKQVEPIAAHPADSGYAVVIDDRLHLASVEYFRLQGIDAKLKPTEAASGSASDLSAGTGNGGKSDVGGSAVRLTTAAGQADDRSNDSAILQKAHAVFLLLQDHFPAEFMVKPLDGVSESDMLQFVAKNRRLFTNLPDPPKHGRLTRNLDKFKAFLDRWKAALQQQRDADEGDTTSEGEGAPPRQRFQAAGRILVTPKLNPANGDKYVRGSMVDALMYWEGTARGWMSAFPHWAVFDWKLIDDKTERIESAPFFGPSRGKDEWSVDVPDRNGRFRLVLRVVSDHFFERVFQPQPILMPTVDEASREKQVFDTAFVGDDESMPFSRGKDGKLYKRDGEKALTIDDEITSLDAQIGGIDALAQQGKLGSDEAVRFKQYYENEKNALKALQSKTSGSTTYFVRASFVSRESSASIPTLRTYMVRDSATTSADTEQDTVQAHYKVTLYDTTLDQANYTQHPGEGSASLKAQKREKALLEAERAAVVAMVAHIHSHNDYPRGTIRIAVQLQQSTEVYETTIDTNNWKKPAEKAIGYVGMAAGVALIVAAPFTGGGSVVAGLVLIGSVAGLLGAGLALEEQYAKEGTIKADSRLALNLLTIATSLVGLSQMGSAFRLVKDVSRGMMLATASFNLGAAGVQGVLIAHDVVRQLDEIEAKYKPKLDNLTPGTPEYDSTLREYKSEVAQCMGSAALNGAFMLVAVGQGVHGLREIPAAGAMSKKTYQVHAETQDLVQNFVETRDASPINQRLRSGVVTPDERAYLQEALGKIPAKDLGEGATATTGAKATGAHEEPVPKANAADPKKPTPAGQPVDPVKPADPVPGGEGHAAPGESSVDPNAAKPQSSTDSEAPSSKPTPGSAVQADLPKPTLQDVQVEAKRAYAQAKKAGYKGEFKEQDFVDRYTDPGKPKRYDVDNHVWMNEATESKPAERLHASTPLDDAMSRFTGPDSTSSFKPFYDHLVAEGLATEADVRAALRKLLDNIKRANGRSVDDVRHDLKEPYKIKMLDRMFNAADGKPLTPEQSHEAMLRMTKDLNSADKGSLTERWIDGFRSLDPAGPKAGEVAKHVEVTQNEHPDLGLAKDRVLDRVEGTTLNEVKSGDGPVSDHATAQHADNMKIVGKEGGTSIDVEGKPQQIERAKLTFTSPEGAKANVDWIVDELTANKNLSVEVFSADHRRGVFDRATMDKDGAALRAFLQGNP